MNIGKIEIILLILFFSIQSVAQSKIEDLVQEGIQYHDNGDYDKAIETYLKALKINPQSTLASYEIALSYFAKGEYQKAIEYSDEILTQNKDYMLHAYITKGSALDMLGQTKESIKLFEKAIKKIEPHYLLYYNLAINQYKENDLDKAEQNAINAVKINSNHASSHLMLVNINNQKGNSVQTVLATHYFLLLEPNTKRSVEVYQILKENFEGNVTKDKHKPNTVNIKLSSNNESQFGSAELLLSMLEASKSLEENKGKSDDELFVENTKSFFNLLSEQKQEKDKEIWWTLYSSFYSVLAKSEHLETYCKYISQSSNINSQQWLTDNKSKLTAFSNWLKEH
jgi:tetratricopeptide (TPR) repeat protein